MQKAKLVENSLTVSDLALECPFTASALDCGTWCPLLEVVVASVKAEGPIGRAGLTDSVKQIHLHCGAGTREFELEIEDG